MPSAEKSPVRDSEAPMTIGAVVAGLELVVVLVLLLLLLELLHDASMLADSTAAALAAMAFLESQGILRPTPGSSFVLCCRHSGGCVDEVSLEPRPSGTSACSLTSGSPAESACCCRSAAKSDSPYPRPTRLWMSW